jgi:hypothetical protein
MKRIALLTMVGALLAFGAAGCGEREQAALYKDGKYRGKSDTRPWDNASAGAGAGSWTKGDRETWENQVRSRNIASQNEHRRIGH